MLGPLHKLAYSLNWVSQKKRIYIWLKEGQGTRLMWFLSQFMWIQMIKYYEYRVKTQFSTCDESVWVYHTNDVIYQRDGVGYAVKSNMLLHLRRSHICLLIIKISFHYYSVKLINLPSRYCLINIKMIFVWMIDRLSIITTSPS